MNYLTLGAVLLGMVASLQAVEYHVDGNQRGEGEGTAGNPFRTIQQAANVAMPGDTITVHGGIYRERIDPPRGGTSDEQRIVYRAAPGESVTIKGSEHIKGWEKVSGDCWKVTLPNSFFGDFNPYSDQIHGDWYDARQPYHTGAVYLNGHWLKEAPRMAFVLGDTTNDADADLMNVQFLRVPGVSSVNAVDRTSQGGQAAELALADGKKCMGPLKNGDWLAFEGVDFGKEGVQKLIISTGSPVGGGIVEIRRDNTEGELLGRLNTGLTAEWSDFQSFTAKLNQALVGRQTIVLVFKARPMPPPSESDAGYWFAEVDEDTTTIWAEFKAVDPNQELVEINVRQTVFYPEETRKNYITVKGFTLEQAATPWSPPTAEQVGLIGVNWSKGWIIEDNTIRYSTCVGITLGKHGDEYDNTMQYCRSIRVGLMRGWNKETIGSHLVRNNHILHCGQAGIVGSLGCAFSTIIGNEIHDIRQNHQYGGCETAGIKLHGAVDVLIAYNHIYRCEHWGGIWLDWMAQGAHVTGNLLHDNSNDLMVEMNHGPMLIDNNIMLSAAGIRDASGGGAYVHNLIVGTQTIWPELAHRRTPMFRPHSTDVIPDAVSEGTSSGAEKPVPLLEQPLTDRFGVTLDQNDDRYFNNLFVKGKALEVYDQYGFKITAGGNVYAAGAKPSVEDRDAVVAKDFDPGIKLIEKGDGWWLEMEVDPAWKQTSRPMVTSALLGKAVLPNAPFEDRDGTPYQIDLDYLGKKRDVNNPAPGPFEFQNEKKVAVKLWPRP